MKTLSSLKFFPAALLLAVLFSNCGKDSVQSQAIQQGKTVIEMNVIFPAHVMHIRYNNVINAPINATVIFHLKDGQKKNVQVVIPAGYKKLQSWGGDNYINSWEDTGYYDSTGNASAPLIDPSWDVSSVEIGAVNCPDKEYGFKILTGADDWHFYHPKDMVTSLSFVANKDTVSYADYDFNAGTNVYRQNLTAYGFYFFGSKAMLFSSVEQYPLSEGMAVKIPLMVYYWNQRNYGSQPDNVDSSNGSTILLTITNLTATHFDATFVGKLWSSRQSDTLFISNGKIKNASLPVKWE